jgi:hypothetical protein
MEKEITTAIRTHFGLLSMVLSHMYDNNHKCWETDKLSKGSVRKLSSIDLITNTLIIHK